MGGNVFKNSDRATYQDIDVIRKVFNNPTFVGSAYTTLYDRDDPYLSSGDVDIIYEKSQWYKAVQKYEKYGKMVNPRLFSFPFSFFDEEKLRVIQVDLICVDDLNWSQFAMTQFSKKQSHKALYRNEYFYQIMRLMPNEIKGNRFWFTLDQGILEGSNKDDKVCLHLSPKEFLELCFPSVSLIWYPMECTFSHIRQLVDRGFLNDAIDPEVLNKAVEDGLKRKGLRMPK